MSCVGLTLLLPILLITAAFIKIESRGPVIFKQKRIGLDGKVFNIYKFRSMCQGAEKTGSGVYSDKNDARVTKVGKFIRATSIDEFPQFINILKGDMSLIGPRPVLTYHPWEYNEYTKTQLKRFSVRPGVTGLAQVNGRKEINWDKRIEYDVEYTQKMSLSFDAKIFFTTIVKVFTNANNENTGVTASKAVSENEIVNEESLLVEGVIE